MEKNIQNCRSYRVDTGNGTDGRTDGDNPEYNPPPPPTPQQLHVTNLEQNIAMTTFSQLNADM